MAGGTDVIVPRRSVLYMPGANDKALEKAKTLACDAIIFDTEDSVAPDMKAAAREKVAAAARSGEYGDRELTIRVNGLDTDWFADDIASASAAGPAGIVVPKVNSAEDVATIIAAMEANGAPAHTQLWAMLETPIAMENAWSIATASDRLAVLVMGTNDLAKELRAGLVPGRAPLLWGLGRCLNAARAAGKVILDGVYNDVRNPEGFAAECAQGADMGFDGKTLIHPTHVAVANRAFAPSDGELEDARKILAAFELPENQSKGAISLNGRMVERLHADIARQVVAMGDAIAARAA